MYKLYKLSRFKFYNLHYWIIELNVIFWFLGDINFCIYSTNQSSNSYLLIKIFLSIIIVKNLFSFNYNNNKLKGPALPVEIFFLMFLFQTDSRIVYSSREKFTNEHNPKVKYIINLTISLYKYSYNLKIFFYSNVKAN